MRIAVYIFAGISALITLSSCATMVEGISSTDQISQTDSLGYISLNFVNNSMWECSATIQDTLTKKSYRIALDRPEQQTNTLAVLGVTVYEKKVGKPVDIHTTTIPLKPATYRVKYIYLKAGRDSYGGFGSKEVFTVRPKTITYLGKVTADIFILIFPWKFSLKSIDNSSSDLLEFSQSIPTVKQIVNFK